MKLKWTYRKVLNRGFTPCWYRTDHGTVVAWIEKEGPKWMYLRFPNDTRKRKPVSEKRYLTPFKSKRG